ncbi:FtsX-like permease family protein [Streptomyces sp. NPDC056500]|uniref:FtsX-like permease family protein n=1 Tax=Streptomyces sp. NPDC056500 TaxID=3345840 RepID=UPI003690D4AF
MRVLHGGDRAEAENRETVAGRDFALAISASFGLLAAVFTMVIVSGPFSISVQQRRREIALLRAVGASHGTVRGMVCGEALILASVGTLLGGPLGLLLAEPMREVLVSAGILPAQLSLSRSLLPLLAAAILSLIGVQAAALMAVRRASRIRPVEALREADAPPQGVSGWRTLGGVLVLVLVLVLVVGVVLTLRNQSEGGAEPERRRDSSRNSGRPMEPGPAGCADEDPITLTAGPVPGYMGRRAGSISARASCS